MPGKIQVNITLPQKEYMIYRRIPHGERAKVIAELLRRYEAERGGLIEQEKSVLEKDVYRERKPISRHLLDLDEEWPEEEDEKEQRRKRRPKSLWEQLIDSLS
ncbi:MAG: hypothetical protein ACETV1_05055 [Candidatus Bathyarchaeia archaeon]